MYFAVEPPSSNVITEIGEALDILQSAMSGPLHVFALVDCAFDESAFADRKWGSRSLYENTSLHELGRAAPHLLPAPLLGKEQRNWLKSAFAICSGKPMLSIIASTLSLTALRDHLRPYLVARTSDGLEWPVRWADTRVLPGLLDALNDSQRRHLFSPLHSWRSVTREGGNISWQGEAIAQPDAADFDKLPLNEDAFAYLVDQAEADAVLANLYDIQPDLLRQLSPTECHKRVALHLKLADKHGIRAAGARQHFGMLALNLGNNISEHPAMTALLRRTAQGADYLKEIRELPENFWSELVTT